MLYLAIKLNVSLQKVTFDFLSASSEQLTFGAGVYTGIYVSQNYEVPRVDEPGKLLEKAKEFADQYKKP